MATTSTIHTETGTGPDGSNDQPQDLHELTTESSNEASMGFDTKSALEIARIINHEDSKIAAAVKKSLPEIALVIDMVARSLRDGRSERGFHRAGTARYRPPPPDTQGWGYRPFFQRPHPLRGSRRRICAC